MSDFWRDRRVLLTGHTGFKGSWLALWLSARGAQVHGLALAPETQPALFDRLGLAERIDHYLGDIRDAELVRARVAQTRPEVVFHLAAQPLVRRSYREPLATFSTNVMGTAHLLDALRAHDAPCAVVVVTTDKVYENREWLHAYRETDALGGHDPYAASKAACEIMVESYRKSFFADGPVRLASARAGNVIGGGDWSEDRILPDLIRAMARGEPPALRNPGAIRPWQHALDPLAGYLLLAERLHAGDPAAADAFNFGPDPADQRAVRDLAEAALALWPGAAARGWRDASDPDAPHEAGRLTLATDKARAALGWSPRWGVEEALRRTIDWHRAERDGAEMRAVSLAQIAAFEAGP